MHLVYMSRPFGFDDATLNAILHAARRLNKRDRITGALIARRDVYLQLLEGPHEAVTACYSRILRDGRHVEVACLLFGATHARLFPDWDMRNDPVRPWMWAPADVNAGAAHKASPAELRSLFARLAAEPVANQRASA
jgi:hypothetical protein